MVQLATDKQLTPPSRAFEILEQVDIYISFLPRCLLGRTNPLGKAVNDRGQHVILRTVRNNSRCLGKSGVVLQLLANRPIDWGRRGHSPNSFQLGWFITCSTWRILNWSFDHFQFLRTFSYCEKLPRFTIFWRLSKKLFFSWENQGKFFKSFCTTTKTEF